MVLDLSGQWRAAVADDDLRRVATGLDFDDSRWEPITVPGHWRTTSAFAEADGPLIYRTRFELVGPRPGRRQWVTLDGVYYQGDVWLDGAYLGDPEGYFVPHSYEITPLARLASEHVLAIEVTSPRPGNNRAKRTVTGLYQNSDWLDPAWNPGGLWRSVQVTETGPVRIAALRVLARDVSEARANVVLRAKLDSDAARPVRIRTLVDGQVVAVHERPLARRVNEVEWNIDIDNPPIWWPWSLVGSTGVARGVTRGPAGGESHTGRVASGQPLVDITVEIDVDHQPSDRRTVRTGLREVVVNDWVVAVNGERLFTKGVNLAPTRMALGDASPEEIRRDVSLARDAGLDLLRVHTHVARPELYAAADELGMLIWQDLPLHGGYARSVRSMAVRQAEALVDQLGHHPSIALWCAHNEPFAIDGDVRRDQDSTRLALSYVATQQLPTWNRTILDRWVKRALEKADPTRTVVAHSGVLPHLPLLEGTDSHFYFAWHHGVSRDLARVAAAVPRLVRFVSEFGAQAVPESAGFMTPERWPNLDWDYLAAHHGMHHLVFEERFPSMRFASFDDWRAAGQRYQAEVARAQIETLRRLKYRPAGGFCLSFLADAHPAVSCSLLDHERIPKPAYHAVIEACRPVIVVLERLPEFVQPGATWALDVHVVSDLRDPIDAAEVSLQMRWATGEHTWRFGGTIAADDCLRVGTVQFVVPDVAGSLTFDLTLEAPRAAATNRYEALISRD